MTPSLASCLCFAFIVWLLWRDLKQNTAVSGAIWIPVFWILLIGARLPSEWMAGSAAMLNASGSALVEGSPLDRNLFLGLMLAGAVVLVRRSPSWSSLATNNVAITLFFTFTFISIFWSEFPLTAFKRWHKVFGHVIMALVVLTESSPHLAFATLLRRCAYVLIPVSVLFVKYYPELGRGYDMWTGALVEFGVTTNKNALGNLCFIFGVFFVAMLFVAPKGRRIVAGTERYIALAFLAMSGWLLIRAQSSTCLVSAIVGTSVILGMRTEMIRRHFSALLVSACLVAGLLLAFTDIKDEFITSLGEDTTLTGRTELWDDLQAIEINPLVGVGFESFWLGDRLERLWRKYWWHPNQAHNGYFETYLNLGLIGLLLQCSMMLAGYVKARRQTLIPPHADDGADALRRGLGEFRLAFMLGLAGFNMTDATFKAVHLSFFMFFLAALEYRAPLAAVSPWLQRWSAGSEASRNLRPVTVPATTRRASTGRELDIHAAKPRAAVTARSGRLLYSGGARALKGPLRRV